MKDLKESINLLFPNKVSLDFDWKPSFNFDPSVHDLARVTPGFPPFGDGSSYKTSTEEKKKRKLKKRRVLHE